MEEGAPHLCGWPASQQHHNVGFLPWGVILRGAWRASCSKWAGSSALCAQDGHQGKGRVQPSSTLCEESSPLSGLTQARQLGPGCPPLWVFVWIEVHLCPRQCLPSSFCPPAGSRGREEGQCRHPASNSGLGGHNKAASGAPRGELPRVQEGGTGRRSWQTPGSWQPPHPTRLPSALQPQGSELWAEGPRPVARGRRTN